MLELALHVLALPPLIEEFSTKARHFVLDATHALDFNLETRHFLLRGLEIAVGGVVACLGILSLGSLLRHGLLE